ncbi:c-type cytochrome [Salinarimonas rosea]|uniref:c-type cytochrome n=1 Tax=Salinarimonas rosea TaxID=552063 RepID=UPI000412F47D|nr:cytochrome c [Salinarimonas rosea]
MRNALLGILVAALVGTLGAVAFLYSGLYPIGATTQHSRVVYAAVEVLVRRAVARSASAVTPPDAFDDGSRVEEGLSLYRGWCAQCHGAPGVAPAPFATGMNPTPPPLVQTARERSPAEIWWVIDNGIAMAGMPSFRFKLTEEEMWAVTAFVETLPALSPAAYAAMVEASGPAPEPSAQAERGGGT